MTTGARTIVERFAAPAALVACVAAEIAWGGDALPRWTANVATKTGIGTDAMLRGLIAAQLAAAALALVFPRLAAAIAWATFGALAFSGLAELSALVNGPGEHVLPPATWVAPFLGLGTGLAGVVALTRTSPAPPRPWRAPGAWQVFLSIFVLGGAMAVAGRLALVPRHEATPSLPGVETVVLNAEEWIGRSIPETGLGRHLPELTAATLEGTKWVVLYQPTCGRCHEVFRAYFGGPQREQVVAVAVPTPPDVEAAASDQPADVACEECVRLTLPPGRRWILTTPTVIRLEGGRITCVSTHDFDRCRPAPGTVR